MAEDNTPGIGVMLGGNGACPEFKHKGTVWKVGRPAQKAKKRLELLVKKVALDEVRELKGVLAKDAYGELFDAKTRNLSQYDTWREGWQAVVQDPTHAHLFLWSLLQEHHPDVTEEDIRELCEEAPEEVQAALAQVIPDFFQMLLEDVLAKVPKDKPNLREHLREQAAAALDELRARLMPTLATNST